MRNRVTWGKTAVRLAMCASVAGLALAGTAAHAVVVTSNTPFVVPFNIDGTYLNVVTGVGSSTAATGYDINPYFSGSTGATPVFRFFLPSTGGIVGTGTAATALSFGTVVGASSTYITGVTSATVATPGTSYYGFKFVNEATTATNYGYIAVQQTSALPSAGSVTVLGYAYENSGASITVAAISAVPEPASLAMMFGGLLAVGGLAKRRLAANRQDA